MNVYGFDGHASWAIQVSIEVAIEGAQLCCHRGAAATEQCFKCQTSTLLQSERLIPPGVKYGCLGFSQGLSLLGYSGLLLEAGDWVHWTQAGEQRVFC